MSLTGIGEELEKRVEVLRLVKDLGSCVTTV
jgi:hypothetical protein